MALPFRTNVIPQCATCTRRIARLGLGLEEFRPASQQVRGKKNKSYDGPMPVRLLRDVKGFGRKGAIVPIAYGRMRNEWFPRHIAQYITPAELKQLGLKREDVERDALFRLEPEEKSQIMGEEAAKEEGVKGVEVKLLTPQRATELIQILLPPRLDFYRTAILAEADKPKAPTTPEPTQPQRRGGVAADLLAAASFKPAAPEKPKEDVTHIYGSVSTSDIANSINAVLAENEEASRVVLTDNDVVFVDAGAEREDSFRVKRLGDFTIEIKVKNAEEAVRRTVRVIAQRFD